jgi:DNA-binding IclR family transcriptional regulator
VRSLAEGFEDEQWISAVAGPALAELTRHISWPCDVSALDGLKMVIHETTHRIAPLSIDRNMVGQELPILGSASGLAYIAFAPKQERDALLALLARSSDPHDALARDPAQASRLIAATRRRGYGLRQGGQIWPHTGSLALPIHVGQRRRRREPLLRAVARDEATHRGAASRTTRITRCAVCIVDTCDAPLAGGRANPCPTSSRQFSTAATQA